MGDWLLGWRKIDDVCVCIGYVVDDGCNSCGGGGWPVVGMVVIMVYGCGCNDGNSDICGDGCLAIMQDG